MQVKIIEESSAVPRLVAVGRLPESCRSESYIGPSEGGPDFRVADYPFPHIVASHLRVVDFAATLMASVCGDIKGPGSLRL